MGISELYQYKLADVLTRVQLLPYFYMAITEKMVEHQQKTIKLFFGLN